jgi:TolB protein
MSNDPNTSGDSAVIDRYLETVRDVDTQRLARLREQLAATPHPHRRRRRFTIALPSATIPALVTAIALIVGSVALIQHSRNRASAGHPGTAADGGTILFVRQNHWYTMAPNGTHLHMLLSSTADCSDFGCAFFSPDGTRIMVAAHPADRIRVATAIIRTNGSGYHVLPLPDSRLNLGPGAWAPSGSRIALAGWDDSNKSRAGLYVVNSSDGKGLVRLTTSPDGRHDDPLLYSPDGSRLLFYHEGTQGSSGGPGFGGLFETTAAGSGRVKLNPPGTYVTADFGSPASWSPDGKHIAFTAFDDTRAGVSAVFVENANGSNRHRITPWGEWSTSARWSPDGSRIVFDRLAMNGYHNLFVVHPDGTGLKAITSNAQRGLGACCSVWSPTGYKLLTSLVPVTGTGHLVTMNADGSHLETLPVSRTNNDNWEYAWGR